MWRLARANLRAGITALLPAGISIMLATAFLAVAMLSTPLISTAALRMYALDYGHADVVVESVAGPLTQRSVDELAALREVGEFAAQVGSGDLDLDPMQPKPGGRRIGEGAGPGVDDDGVDGPSGHPRVVRYVLSDHVPLGPAVAARHAVAAMQCVQDGPLGVLGVSHGRLLP